MFDTAKVLICALPDVRPILARSYGRGWPLALVRCAARARTLLGQTRWAGRTDAEARYVRALALVPAAYLDLRERIGERALAATQDLAVALLTAANERTSRDAIVNASGDPYARWHSFFERTVAGGIGRFNENECLSLEVEKFHFRVRRCVFADLGRDLGLPELACMACELAVPFCRDLLPAHGFRRNGSLQSTLAYGHPHCDYVWEPRSAAPVGADAGGGNPGQPKAPGDTNSRAGLQPREGPTQEPTQGTTEVADRGRP